MALAGGLGVEALLDEVCYDGDAVNAAAPLFSESPTRFVLEVRPDAVQALLALFEGLAIGRVGVVVEDCRLVVRFAPGSIPLIDAPLSALKEAWQAPLRW